MEQSRFDELFELQILTHLWQSIKKESYGYLEKNRIPNINLLKCVQNGIKSIGLHFWLIELAHFDFALVDSFQLH